MGLSLLLGIVFSVSAMAQVPATLDLPVPEGKIAKLRVYQEMRHRKAARQVLVGAHLIPPHSRVRISLREPLLYRWILTDLGHVVQSSMPYFPVRVLSLPDDYREEDREAILQGAFFVHIRDLDDARIISEIFRNPLPRGVEKVTHPLPWDAYNPNGTWAHAVEKGLRVPANSFLVKGPPRDIADFCPRFTSLGEKQKELFWILLAGQIARFESAFIPLTAADEGRFDEGNKGIISSGLTQISIASTRASCYQARGCTLIRNQEDLFDPDRNLRCAVAIMSCLSESGGCLSCKRGNSWFGIARYWSTMRDPYEVRCPTCPGGKVTIGKKPQIQAQLRGSASFCF
jgi:hypothetical protein